MAEQYLLSYRFLRYRAGRRALDINWLQRRAQVRVHSIHACIEVEALLPGCRHGARQAVSEERSVGANAHEVVDDANAAGFRFEDLEREEDLLAVVTAAVEAGARGAVRLEQRGAKAMLATSLTALTTGMQVTVAFEDTSNSCNINRLTVSAP